MESKPSATVIVVSYNTCDDLRACLRSIESSHPVVVVDNASTDGSADMVEREFPRAQLIRNAVNRGFGAANNQGVDSTETKLVLFLNPDCRAEPGAIERLGSLFGDPGVCAAGGRLLHPDGRLQQSAARMLSLWHVFLEQTMLERLLGGYWTTPANDGIFPVGQVMGACLMIRTGSARFDEDYFLYCEDTDLIYRLRQETGGKVLYHGDARFVHQLGASSSGAARWVSVARYNRGKELYFRKHFGAAASAACWVLDRMGACLRLGIWSAATVATLFLVPAMRRRAALWMRVLTAPRAGPHRPDRTSP